MKLQRLGAGNFGEVWLVHDYALGVRRAVKYVPAASITDPTNFYNELSMGK
jgi:serine/threonine protein kinase